MQELTKNPHFAKLPQRMKTNKSFTKRLTVTKNGKVKARRPGINHFNAKQSRSSQLNGKVEKNFTMTAKSTARFLPGLV
jgi:ribosomal protein L35